MRPSTIRLLTWCAILNCGFCGLAFAGDLASANPRSAGRVPEVPFKLYQGCVIVVLRRIGNLENQNLLLDTGSYPSLVDKNACTKLGLQGTPKRLSLFNKNISSEVVLLPDLQFGPVTRRNLPVMVADFAGISGGLRIRIDAVIGVDVLGGTSFTVDYEKHRVLLLPTFDRTLHRFLLRRASSS